VERDLAIRALHEGDRLVVHSAPRIGSTEAEIRAAAAAVAAQGASIYDCEAAAEVRFHPDAGKLLAWAEAGAVLAAKERAGTARAKIKRRGAPPKALTPAAIKQAGELRAAGNSWAKVAAELKVSVRTLYRHVSYRLPDGSVWRDGVA
jgi:DNA invertase Pin-like site-specific DNA recombinase